MRTCFLFHHILCKPILAHEFMVTPLWDTVIFCWIWILIYIIQGSIYQATHPAKPSALLMRCFTAQSWTKKRNVIKMKLYCYGNHPHGCVSSGNRMIWWGCHVELDVQCTTLKEMQVETDCQSEMVYASILENVCMFKWPMIFFHKILH